MKTIHTFSLSKLSDEELMELASNCCEERQRRERQHKEQRDRWVGGYYCAFLNNPNARAVRVNETTVVAIWSRTLGLVMGTAIPVRGDVFDRNTGIAVAYAKAVGDKIPDYI